MSSEMQQEHQTSEQDRYRKGLTGLVNLGNMLYEPCIQMLSNT